LENAKIKAEIELNNSRSVNTTLKSNIDYTSQNNFLRQRIQELKGKIQTERASIYRS